MGPVTVSVVSHGHGALIPGLLEDFAACPEVGRVVLTRNVPEPDYGIVQSERLLVLDNSSPKGFGANHNAVFFHHVKTPYFAVVNPDIRLVGNVFPTLMQCLEETSAGLSAPAVVNPRGAIEDSARRFPTPGGLVLKLLGLNDGRLNFGDLDPSLAVPWLAGMFMLLRSNDFAAVNGFDEGFFLYYEDVDLCARMWRAGRAIRLCPSVKVVHDARRASRRNPQHMAWHAASMARYFVKHLGRLPKAMT